MVPQNSSSEQRLRGYPAAKGLSAMTPVLAISSGATVAAALMPDLRRAGELAREEKSLATRRAYKSDFRLFEVWCQGRGVSALPAAAEVVAAFLAHDVGAGSRPSTLAAD